MEKINYLLLSAGLFIAFVMILVLFQGVSPKERKMVKWSSVKSPEKAGDRLALFLFPLLKESKTVNIQKPKIPNPQKTQKELTNPNELTNPKEIPPQPLKKSHIRQKPNFQETFFKAFLKRATTLGIKTKIQSINFIPIKERAHPPRPQTHPPDSKDFFITIFPLNELFLTKLCQTGEPMGCVGIKSLKQFKKKSRDPSFYWISMYRMGKDQAALFFKPPDPMHDNHPSL